MFVYSLLLRTAPHFVSMYEIGEFVYVFFQEKALETAENVSACNAVELPNTNGGVGSLTFMD